MSDKVIALSERRDTAAILMPRVSVVITSTIGATFAMPSILCSSRAIENSSASSLMTAQRTALSRKSKIMCRLWLTLDFKSCKRTSIPGRWQRSRLGWNARQVRSCYAWTVMTACTRMRFSAIWRRT